jgi:hypothetical protein
VFSFFVLLPRIALQVWTTSYGDSGSDRNVQVIYDNSVAYPTRLYFIGSSDRLSVDPSSFALFRWVLCFFQMRF